MNNYNTPMIHTIDNYSASLTNSPSRELVDLDITETNDQRWKMVIGPTASLLKSQCVSQNIDISRLMVFPKKYVRDAFYTVQHAINSNNYSAIYIASDMLPIDQLEFLFSYAKENLVQLETFESKMHTH